MNISRIARNFAQRYIPSIMEEHPSKFFGAMFSDRRQEAFRAAYSDFTSSIGTVVDSQILGTMDALAFTEQEHLILLLIFPPGERQIGDPIFGGLVVGPLDLNTATPGSMAQAARNYYVLVSGEKGSVVTQLADSGFLEVGLGPNEDLGLFSDWLVASFSSTGNVHFVPNNDEEMPKAIAHAQETLAEVTERFAAGELEAFTVKVRLENEEQAEHFWISNTQWIDGSYRGTIEENGHVLTHIVPGTQIDADPESVTDWMYSAHGKMAGNFTLRAMMRYMPPRQRATYETTLLDYAPFEIKPVSAPQLPNPTKTPPPIPSQAPQNSTPPPLPQHAWPDLKVLRNRCREMMGYGPTLNPLYHRMHYSMLLCALVCAFQLLRRQNASEIWSAMRSRGFRNPFLRDAYRSLSSKGEILKGHPIIANVHLGEAEDDSVAIPGLILGCLDNDGFPDHDPAHDALAAELASHLGELYTMGTENPRESTLEELVNDDTYVRWKRVPIPPEFTNGLRMELFNVLLFPGQIPPVYGPIPFIMSPAKPGQSAPIVQIPWDVMKVVKQHG